MKTVATLLISTSLVICTNAQNVDFYGNALNTSICSQYSITDDRDAQACMDKICHAVGIPNNYALAPCPNVNNCFAVYDKDKGIAYIVYDITFLNRVRSFGFTQQNLPRAKVDWVALTILAHELGHHICQHTTSAIVQKRYTPIEMELQADEFAGNVLYRLGATLDQAQEAMRSGDVPETASITHPGRSDRLAAIAKGYNNHLVVAGAGNNAGFTTQNTGSGGPPVTPSARRQMLNTSFNVNALYTSNIHVNKGDSVVIQAAGSISLGQFVGLSGPEGRPTFMGLSLGRYCIAKNIACGALIVKYRGSEEWLLCANGAVFSPKQDGDLVFNVNDNKQDDNTGAYSVTVTVYR